MDTHALSVFLTVVDFQNLSKAAESLLLSQSAVSFNVKALEEELGITLLNRDKGKRTATLTEKGRQFVPIARKILSLYDQGMLLKKQDSHSISIGCVDSLNVFLFSTFYKRFMNKHPEFDLNIKTCNSHEIFDLMESHQLDMGIIIIPKPSDSIIIEPYIREKLYVVMSTKPKKTKEIRKINVSELDFSKEIYFACGQKYDEHRETWTKGIKHREIRIMTIPLLMSFFDQQEGTWSMVPESIITELRNNNNVTVYDPEPPVPDRIAYKLKPRFPNKGVEDDVATFETEMDAFVREHGLLY